MGQNDVGGASWPGAESLFLALVGGVPLGEEASRPVGMGPKCVRPEPQRWPACVHGCCVGCGPSAPEPVPPGQSCAPEADVGFRQLALESGLTPVGLA